MELFITESSLSSGFFVFGETLESFRCLLMLLVSSLWLGIGSFVLDNADPFDLLVVSGIGDVPIGPNIPLQKKYYLRLELMRLIQFVFFL